MLIKSSPTMLRALWLNESEIALRELFGDYKYPVPKEVRTSWGFPKGSKGGHKGTVIGQCWFSQSSSDQYNEIFLSPALGHSGKPALEDSILVVATHAHEIAHAICGRKAGHRIIRAPRDGERNEGARKEKWRMSFPTCCATVGLQGPWTATSSTPKFDEWSTALLKRIDFFPRRQAGFVRTEERHEPPTEVHVRGLRLHRSHHQKVDLRQPGRQSARPTKKQWCVTRWTESKHGPGAHLPLFLCAGTVGRRDSPSRRPPLPWGR
jgi:hypothetical protein